MDISILTAIQNIITNPIDRLGEFYVARNRINNMGGALEEYVKDIFASTIGEMDSHERIKQFDKVFSYMGNQNNPPDLIIRGGDAVEVKKIESIGADLALNSSYPKAKLFSNSPMITRACRTCEDWNEKDILYVVGVVNKSVLKKLYMIFGIDYAANADVYERIKNRLSKGINLIPDIEFTETKELGRVNRADPLGITYLRIRGMWGIENPAKVFSYIHQINRNKSFELMAIINLDKYMSFSEKQRILFEKSANEILGFSIKDVLIKTPDNPANAKKAKLITYIR